MKTILTIFLFALILVSCSTSKPDGFQVTAEVTNGDSLIVMLDGREQGEWINIDSAVVVDGSFTLNGMMDEPRMVYLKFIDGDEMNYTTLFLENSDIAIKGDLLDVDALDINGSSTHDMYDVFSEGLKVVTEPYDTLYDLLDLAENDATKDSLDKLIKKIESDEEAYVISYINNNAASPVASYAALRSLAYYMEYDELKPVVDAIKAEQEDSKYLDNLNETLAKLQNLAIGSVAPDFTEKDLNGDDFVLSSLKGKIVLVDFWASWCGPCRRENPNVVAMYEELGGEEFEIVGVSLDKKEENWLKGIEEDDLTWIHVSDLQGWKSGVADLYNVKAIPKTYLLDKQGNIVAKNLRGNELKNKIKELLAGES